jgi:elongation factor G
LAASNDGLNRLFYRETVQGSGVGDEKVVRQQGSIGVYAHVRVAVHALSCGEGRIFSWSAGSSIPAKFAPAVARGVQDAMDNGVLAGLEPTDIYASIENGSYHEGDSTTHAFREAAEKAAAAAIRQADPLILEAWSSVRVAVPVEFAAAVERTVVSRGGQLEVIRSDSSPQAITAKIPTSDVNDLIAELLGTTDGHANISVASAGFRPKPEPPDTEGKWVRRA